MVAAQTSRAAIFCATVMLSAYSFGQPSASESETIQLAEQLADPAVEIRQRAFDLLQAKGADAFDALYQLQDSQCLEQRLAIRRLLQLIELEWTAAEISKPLQQLLIAYRRQSAIRRKAMLERIELSEQPATAVVLANLSRFERSQELSSQAAICLIRYCSTHDSRSQLALEAIGNSERKSCIWIRDALEPGASHEFVQRWIIHLQNEIEAEPQTTATWQSDLTFQLLEWSLPQFLARRQRPAVDRIAAQFARNCPDNLLGNLLDLCIRIEAWQAIDQLAERYEQEFDHQPLLLCRVAAAKIRQGERESAIHLMERATQIAQPAQNQLEMGIMLQQLGYSFVAEQTLNAVVVRADCTLPTKVRANLILAQWLSQADRNSEAARRLSAILNQPESIESEPSIFQQLGCSQQEIASTRCMYEALDCLANNDLPGCEACILDGLHKDPNQTDLLILAHRFQFSDPETSDLIQELIQFRQQELLQQIAELNGQARGQQEHHRKSNSGQLALAALANRYAWLTANTTGDIENALRCAQLANDLVSRNPYYLDTEAKCSFVLGDTTRAIALQNEACRLARHDLSLQKQLQTFKSFQGMTPIAKVPSRLR